MIAGILIVAGSLGALMMLARYQSMFGIDGGGVSGMMGGGWWQTFMRGYSPSFIATMAAISLAAGATVLAGAYKMQKEPRTVQIWGFLVLIASTVVALFCIGGFGLGSILGIIGDAVAISWRPS
ncbi:MAG TPA: hypothetical protein VFZ67_11640 [Nitrososphaera sp.]